jgi:outer membrane protein assembly factor BamB
MKRLIAVLAVALFQTAGLNAGDPLAWSRFRGPDGSGVADDQKPPVDFGPDKNVKWKVPIPSGLSSPIVAGDKLVITAFEGGKLYTIAYQRADGKEAWRAEAPMKQLEPYLKSESSPAASTPATDGKRIVSYFGSCGLFCYDLNGKELWRFEMPPVATAGGFGSGVSPILAGGMVVLVRDEMKDAKIVALDAATGSVQWEKKRQSPVSFSTPVIWNTPAGKEIVTTGHGRMIGYELKTGAEKWSVAGMPSGCCTSPVAAGNTLYFAGWSPGSSEDKSFQMPTFDSLLKLWDTNKDGALSREEIAKSPFKNFFDSYDANHDGKISRDEWDMVLKFMLEGKNSAFAVKAGGTGDVTGSHVLWKKKRGLPYVSSALLYRGQYLMVKDGGLVTAYDATTGNEVYVQERVAAPGRYFASPVAANGYIYLIALEGGAVTVLKAGSDKPIVVAKTKLGERTAATPALADNVLYIRTGKHLYAFANENPKP